MGEQTDSAGLNLIFMGNPEFAVASLDALYNSHHTIQAVVTHPDKRRSRGDRHTPTPVKSHAVSLDLPIIEVEDLQDPDFISTLHEYQPDVLVVVAFRILPEVVLQVPAMGAVNVHASLLPRYRGAAPIHWAIIQGETETGCTIFQITREMDAGGILKQQSTPIGENETMGALHDRLKELGAGLLVEALDAISRGTVRIIEQDQSRATRAPKISREDARLDFNDTMQRVHNKIRGMSPVPGAWTLLDGKRLKIYQSRMAPEEDPEPGELRIADNRRLLAGCSDGAVELEQLQLEGRRAVSTEEFLAGYQGRLHIDG